MGGGGGIGCFQGFSIGLGHRGFRFPVLRCRTSDFREVLGGVRRRMSHDKNAQPPSHVQQHLRSVGLFHRSNYLRIRTRTPTNDRELVEREKPVAGNNAQKHISGLGEHKLTEYNRLERLKAKVERKPKLQNLEQLSSRAVALFRRSDSAPEKNYITNLLVDRATQHQ